MFLFLPDLITSFCSNSIKPPVIPQCRWRTLQSNFLLSSSRTQARACAQHSSRGRIGRLITRLGFRLVAACVHDNKATGVFSLCGQYNVRVKITFFCFRFPPLPIDSRHPTHTPSSLCLSVCLSVCLSLSLSLCLCLSLSVFLSLSVSLSLSLSVFVSVCLSVSLSVCLYVCLSLSLSLSLSVCLSVSLSLSLSVSLSLSLSLSLCLSVCLFVFICLSLSLSLSCLISPCYEKTKSNID